MFDRIDPDFLAILGSIFGGFVGIGIGIVLILTGVIP